MGTGRFKDRDGYVSGWHLILFDVLLYLMWWQHDTIYAPIFGRGDGR